MKGLNKEVGMWKISCDELKVTNKELQSDLKARKVKERRPPAKDETMHLSDLHTSESEPSVARPGHWGKARVPNSSVRVKFQG